MRTFTDIGMQIPTVLLPGPGIDLNKWAVIACDQFTSQPEYWQKVEEYVGTTPSTLHMILPEVDLEKTGEEQRIQQIHQVMQDYQDHNLLQPYEGLVYVTRSTSGRTRKGIMLCLDLECYDFSAGSTSLVRATEGTIVARLPPRMKIREQASLELPHILVLIDDPLNSVIEPLESAKKSMQNLYDFDLMMDGGHLSGFAVPEIIEKQVVDALRALAGKDVFSAKYGISKTDPLLLYAMGDGNHSLATAKACWEKNKVRVGLDHPSRYALVEIENVHDEGLIFESIHRVLFGVRKNIFASLQQFFDSNISFKQVSGLEEMIASVNQGRAESQSIGIIHNGGWTSHGVIEITNPSSSLPVGTLQPFLDAFIKDGSAEKIDYVHGEKVVNQLALQPGNIGFYLPAMKKSELFKTVILDGALPRKTFSMGEAQEKRYYMEARRIIY